MSGRITPRLKNQANLGILLSLGRAMNATTWVLPQIRSVRSEPSSCMSFTSWWAMQFVPSLETSKSRSSEVSLSLLPTLAVRIFSFGANVPYAYSDFLKSSNTTSGVPATSLACRLALPSRELAPAGRVEPLVSNVDRPLSPADTNCSWPVANIRRQEAQWLHSPLTPPAAPPPLP